MQLVNAWKKVVLENYATFSGRARRSELWWFVLANFCAIIALLVLGIILGAVSDALGAIMGLVLIAYYIGTIIPILAVQVRRLHDTGRSGWMWLVGLIPLVGGIILIVFLASDSAKGTNSYGPSPKYPNG